MCSHRRKLLENVKCATEMFGDMVRPDSEDKGDILCGRHVGDTNRCKWSIQEAGLRCGEG